MLISAAYHDQIQIAKFLVEEANVDINEKLKSGETALFRACYFNRVEISKYLLEKGADPEGTYKDQWVSPLYQSCHREKEKCVELLLQHGVTIYFERYGAKPNPESPFTEKFLMKSKPVIQDLFYKYHKLRGIRQLLKMHYFIFRSQKGLPIEIPLSIKEKDMIKKHYPKEFLKFNKHMQAKILQKFIGFFAVCKYKFSKGLFL